MENGDGTKTPVIDASVHIFMQSNKDLRKNFMQEPYRSRGFPDYEMDWYQAPGGEYVKGADKSGYPSSDPAVVAEELFGKRGVDIAILHPMTRGIMPRASRIARIHPARGGGLSVSIADAAKR